MTSLTLKDVPEEVMTRLRQRAEWERRSLNQQAIRLLEEALIKERPSFMDAYGAFIERYGPSPLAGNALGGLRRDEPERASPFEEDG